MNLNWLDEFLEALPQTSKTRKNMLSIAGYPSWENVNSNMLAFYFDAVEEHGFQRLFLNSLLDVYESKIEDKTNFEREHFDTSFIVEREVVTPNSKRIDIVIKEDSEDSEEESQSTNWGIIIENKIYADLYNDLQDYYDTVSAVNKIGIVLSVNSEKIPEGKPFVNILHKELVEKVMQNLSSFYMNSDDRHLLFLKEYISNVQSYYQNKYMNKKMDEKLVLFHEKQEEIKKFKAIDRELLQYVSDIVFKIMTEIGYPPYSTKNTSKAKHFFVDREKLSEDSFLKENVEFAEKFRFWIDLDYFRYHNTFWACFELYKKTNTRYGSDLKEFLVEQNVFTKAVKKGEGGSDTGDYNQIYVISFPLENIINEGFEKQLREGIQREFVSKGFLEKAVIGLKKIVENELVSQN
ncbi:PD-(D/E)XK nuclease family protein [Aureivirga sp. CE67]|uniref:PD-(D/E)XK nuclease family protein n=1 Tax=Aureivirga sp. CE67 TaxID=1788983 RepID=UPI0018CAADC3|nr:PD-(D/E)XK nuclease family protein [Aureivirga sp. CE67]